MRRFCFIFLCGVIIGVLIFEPFLEGHQEFVEYVAIYPLSTLPQEDHVPEAPLYSLTDVMTPLSVVSSASIGTAGTTTIIKPLSYKILGTKIISKSLSYAVQK